MPYIRIREVIPDCSAGYIFPLRSVKDRFARTLGPHGDSKEVSFPRRGSMGKVHSFNKSPQKNDSGESSTRFPNRARGLWSGARRRRVNTTRPFGFGTADWRKFTKAQREEILSHVPSQAASSSSEPQIVQIPNSPVVSVPAVSANAPVVTIVGGVHAKMRPMQTEQQSNNEEISDAVVCQKVKAAERTIGTIIKPATKKTDYVKRNIRS